MNIGIVTTWFERGAAYVSRQYMNILKNDDVFIYARGGSYALDDPNWTCFKVTWDSRGDNRWSSTDIDITQFLNWIIENQIELIFFNEQVFLEPIIVAKKHGIIVGAYIDYYRLDSIETFHLYDFLICNTQRHYSVFRNFPQCFYVPWGTDVNLFRPNINSQTKTNAVRFFLSAGYSPRRKGADKAISAFYKIKNENCKLIIHSQIELMASLPELSDVIDELLNEKKLEIIEKSVTAPGLYYMGDVYVYPSWLDGIGLSVAEALASGLPVITTDEAPMNEFGEEPFALRAKVNKHISREDAYYWPLSIVDEDDLCECMLYFIQNADRLSEMKNAARDYAIQKLDWSKNSECVEKIFHSVKSFKLNEEVVMLAKEYDKKNRSVGYRKYLYKNKLIKVLSKLKELPDRTALYCAGIHTDELIDYLFLMDIKIIGIFDKKKSGETCKGIKIFDPADISIIKPEAIIISSFRFQNEVEKELVDTYCFKGKIIKLYDEIDDGDFLDI